MKTPTRPPAPALKVKGLYLRGTTYWYARQINGKRNFVSLETGDPFEAVQAISALTNAEALSDGEWIEFAVLDYIRFCETSAKWTAASLDAKGPVLKQWAKWTGRVEPSKVTTDRIRAYHDFRCTQVARSTAYGNLMTIQGFYNWCKEVKRTCASNPVTPLTERRSTQKIKAPKPGVRKKFCEPELRDSLILECPREELKYILFCGFHAGLRFNEIVESKADWFDLKAGLLHLCKHAGIDFKDKEERTIPLTGEFKAFLKKFGLHKPYMIAPDVEKGRSLYRYDFTRPFKEYMEEKGCPWVTPHVMRHTFASLLASAGCSIFKIAQWMGDDVRVVERHYARLIPSDSEIELLLFGRRSEVPPSLPRPRASTPQDTRRSRKV